MILKETKLKGAFVIEPERIHDERGFFAVVWSEQVFAERGLSTRLAQCNISFNAKTGTLRGMHYQEAPYRETKLVRCTAGAIYDVIIDLRRDSPTFKQWVGVELSASNRRLLYVPEEFAHGFQTLTDDTEVFYQVTQVYRADYARGVRWNDPAFGIDWPAAAHRTIIQRDREYPDFA